MLRPHMLCFELAVVDRPLQLGELNVAFVRSGAGQQAMGALFSSGERRNYVLMVYGERADML